MSCSVCGCSGVGCFEIRTEPACDPGSLWLHGITILLLWKGWNCHHDSCLCDLWKEQVDLSPAAEVPLEILRALFIIYSLFYSYVFKPCSFSGPSGPTPLGPSSPWEGRCRCPVDACFHPNCPSFPSEVVPHFLGDACGTGFWNWKDFDPSLTGHVCSRRSAIISQWQRTQGLPLLIHFERFAVSSREVVGSFLFLLTLRGLASTRGDLRAS